MDVILFLIGSMYFTAGARVSSSFFFFFLICVFIWSTLMTFIIPGSYGESNSMLLDESTVVPSDNKIDEES